MGADVGIRARVADIPTPEFSDTPVVVAPPLTEAKVAIVTTAGLKAAGEAALWQPTDGSFTVLAGSDRDVQLSHFSPNFDRTGFAADINTVFPIDRLDELAAQGIIGRVADEHLAYAGNQFELSAIRMDSGPAGAKRMRAHGVDVVLLTPV